MKFSCTQENLRHGLAVVAHIAAKAATLPILSNVLIRAETGGILLSTTNLEVGVTCTVRGKVEEEGTFTVQARVLSDFVALLPKEHISVERKDQALHVVGPHSKTVLRGTAAEEFPVIPTVDRGETLTVAAAELRQALSQVIFACAFDESRPEISGVFFRAAPKELTLAGTDSYRLAEKRVKLARGPKAETTVIVPGRTVHEIIRVLGDGAGDLTITLTENQILFATPDVSLVSRLIEGQYPDYQQIIPKTTETQAAVETEALTQLVKTASLFCKPGINDLRLAFRPGEQELVLSSANAQVGENESRLPAALKGKENAITFNYRYLLDGLQNIGSPKATLEMTSDAQPGVLRPEKETSYTYLIMPIRQ